MTKKASQGKFALVSQDRFAFVSHEMPKAMTAADCSRVYESDGFSKEHLMKYQNSKDGRMRFAPQNLLGPRCFFVNIFTLR
jgi:hypothetical protein